MPSLPQAKILNPGNGLSSAMGDKIHVNINKGTADNTEKVKNDRTSELDAGNLHKSDGNCERATTEEEGQYAIAKTQQPQCNNQVTEYASGQIEEGATWSEHPQIPFSFSQSQADLTPIENQLEQIIDKVLTEDKEELKENLKKEVMVFLLTIVKDGTLLRSFHPNVSHNMPAHNFYIDFAEKGMDEERTRRSLPNTPMSRSDTARSKSQRSRSPSMSNLELSQGHERDKSNPHVQPHGKKTSTAPDQPIGGTPFSKSCLPAISADGNSRSSSLEEKPGDVLKVAEEKSLDPSQCITEPADEIPYVDSEVNCQGAPEQSTPQTEGTKSLRGETNRAPNQTAGDPRFSKTCLSTESSIQAGKKGSTAMHLNLSLNAASSNKFSSDHEILRIQWNMEPEIKWNEPFEITLYNGKRIKYVIEITCMPEDFYGLKFLFCNTNTVEDLSKSLLEIDCTLKSGFHEVCLGSKIFLDESEIIRDKIEGVIKNVKATSNIQVHCAETSIAKDKLVEKCEEFSSEFQRGNIAVYEKGKRVWIVGRNSEEMEVLEKRLIEDNVLQKAPYSSKDYRGHTTVGEAKNEENLRISPGQTTLPGSSDTVDSKLLYNESNKKNSIKPRPTDMLEMIKETNTDTQDTFNNKLSQETVSTSQGRTNREKNSERVSREKKSTRNVGIIVQIGTEKSKEFDLPCQASNYFKWLYCLLDDSCLATLQESFHSEGCYLQLLENKQPVFMFPSIRKDIAEPLQYAFQKTVAQHDIIYHLFNLDLGRPEEEVIRFCKSWNNAKKSARALLFFDKSYGKIMFCLVGKRTDVDLLKPCLESNLNKFNDVRFADDAELHTWKKNLDSACIKVLEKMKNSFENMFQVKISLLGTSEAEITATTEDNVNRVLQRVQEMSESIQMVKLPYEHYTFLMRSEKARVYVETELRRNGFKIHFLIQEIKDCAILNIFEENNMKFFPKLQDLIFYIPATDTLCHIFMSEKGKEIFADLVKENDGKLQMILDDKDQPCCLGTKDIEEKFRSTVANYMSTTKEYVKLPSEEVWRFCKQRNVFRDIGKKACCEVHYVENAELPWTVYVSGPSALVSDCCGEIEKNISKILTKTITSIDFCNESAVTSLILKMNKEKRCFINIRSGRFKSPAPWKKWMEKKGMEINRIYFVNLNSSFEIHDDEIKLVLIPEEKKGAKSRRPFDPIPGTSNHFQMFIPGSNNDKFKDFVTERFKEILKYNQDNLQKRCLILDCECVPKECLKKLMKVICHTIDTTTVCIYKFEFCDTRLEMFYCMIEVIDTHFNNKKNYEFLEWKGRSIEMDVQSGQLALQKGFDVLVNSASISLNLDAGVISASLLKAAGSGIQNEINKHKGKVRPSDIVVTKGYNLDCKNVFHGFIPKNVSSEKIQCLRTMVRKCLEKADEMGMESIAFPALGTGNLGYNRRDVANALFDEVEKYEIEAKIGSLNLVCCVIYEGDIDAIKDFQSRLLKWKQDHKVHSVEKEVIVTSDNPDVMKEICREVTQAMRQTVAIWEPQKAEITEDMRKGNISTTEADTESNHTKKKKQGSSQRGDYSSEERLCLLLKAKEDITKDIANSWRESIREDFRDIAENIVCPFESPNQALLQFSSENDVEDVFKSETFKEKYEVQKFPPQAVKSVEAVLSSKMTQLLIKKHISPAEIRRNSGVSVQKNATGAIVLCGNILEIKAAYAYFSSIVKEASLSETEKEDIVRNKAHESRENHLPNDEIPGHAPRITTVLGDNNAPQSRTIPRSDHRASEEKLMQVPKTEIKSDVLKVDYITCKKKDVMLLNYFFDGLMKNVEEIRDQGQSIILRFHDQQSKKSIEESLQKIKKMSRVKFPVPSIDSIDALLLKKCTDDTLCFISEDRQHVEIIGSNGEILNNIKEELETKILPDLESKKVDSHFESPEMPVFVTDEGISVYVKCSSLLNLQTPVDAIVCPISNQESLYHGLPKVISEFAGQGYIRKLKEILKENENAFPDLFVAVIPTENISFCSYVVNVSTNRRHLSKQESEPMGYEQFLLQLMLQIFCKAEEIGIRSIAIPAICSGKREFTKELCAQCYGTSVVKYSRTIDDETKGLKEIRFVDKSPEILSYIESVFTQPECLDRFETKAMEMARSTSDDHSLYPYYTEGGNFHLNEKLRLTVLTSEVSKLNSSEGILVYYENFDKTEKKKVFANWLQHAGIKQPKPCKGVMFLKHNSIMSTLEHAILPVWREETDLNKFGSDLSDFYRLIFLEANKLNPLKLVMPLYGSLKGNEIVTRISTESLFKVLCEVSESFPARSAKLSILLANEDKQTCSIIMDEIRLLIDYDQAGLLSSTSKKPTNRRHGKQPRGHIVCRRNKKPLKGYKCGTIEMYVSIPDGKQQNYHPHPKERFIGRKETIFLPDNDIGHSIACLLLKAFNQRILYCIQTSNVQNIDIVKETDIPIFNKRENYPNSTKLQKLKDLLHSKVGS